MNKIEFVELIEDLSRTNKLSHEYKVYKLVETEQRLEQHAQVCRETVPKRDPSSKKVKPRLCVSKGKIFPKFSNKGLQFYLQLISTVIMQISALGNFQ